MGDDCQHDADERRDVHEGHSVMETGELRSERACAVLKASCGCHAVDARSQRRAEATGDLEAGRDHRDAMRAILGTELRERERLSWADDERGREYRGDVQDAEKQDRGQISATDLIDELERNLVPRFPTNRFGGRVGLLDAVVHHQDFRRPLGLPRSIPEERLVECLRFAPLAVPLGTYSRIRGLRLTATDVGWSVGHGPSVTDPGESLLMAMAGRKLTYDDLDGPGVATLLSRIGSAD